MGKHRAKLPQMNGKICLTEGGVETYVMYQKGFELPHFALFDLLNNPPAMQVLDEYYRNIIAVAHEFKTGMILDGLDYRGSRDWGHLLGYSSEGLAEIVTRGVRFFQKLADELEAEDTPLIVGGLIGPRGDAYNIGQAITADEAMDYHAEQIDTLHAAGADMVSCLTLSHVDEAIGMARAAKEIGIPAVLSFMLDETGKLATGPALDEAIEQVDDATGSAPAYYMVNCTHPLDFATAFEAPGDWVKRVMGLRPNASPLEKGVLCDLGHLEAGDPAQLGQQIADMARRFPHMTVFGGCCGTDWTHISEIAKSVMQARILALSRRS